MTDLQRLHDWHGSEGSEFAKVLANGDKKKLAAVANHAETARILSVLEAVREGCDIQEIESWEGDQQMLMIVGRFKPLHALAELLGGGK